MGGVPPAMNSFDSDPAFLLENEQFLRSLAAALLDAQEVDDVVQQTWLRLLSSRRDDVLSPRAWLATVTKNLARNWIRSDTRRRSHEVMCQEEGVVPSAADLAIREDSRRRVVAAVHALEEPFRTAIVLRYFEGEPPRSIARRLELKVSVVYNRLRRGLELLRESLDAEYGDRRSWGTALVPLAGPVAKTSGVWILSLAAVFVIGLSSWFYLDGQAAQVVVEQVVVEEAQVESPSVELVSSLRTESSAGVRRRPLEGEEASLQGAMTVLSGRVLGNDDRLPLVGCEVSLKVRNTHYGEIPIAWKKPDPVITNSQGRFEIRFNSLPMCSASIGIEKDKYAPIGVGGHRYREGLHDFGDVSLVPGVDIRVRFVDERGEPWRNQQVYLMPAERELRWGEGTVVHRAVLKTDDLGWCMSHYPVVARSYKVAIAESHSGKGKLFPGPTRFGFEVKEGGASTSFEVALARVPPGGLLTGRIIDQQGLPVCGLTVGFVQGAQRLGYAETNSSGVFSKRVSPMIVGECDVVIFSMQPHHGVVWRDPVIRVNVDETIVVHREPEGRVTLDVVDAMTGAALADFGLLCVSAVRNPNKENPFQERRALPCAQGSVVLHRPAGEYLVSVFPSSRDLCEVGEMPVVFVSGEHQRVRVEIHKSEPCKLVLTRGLGVPAAGSTVQVVRLVPGGSVSTMYLPLQHFRRGLDTNGQYGVILAEAVSDGQGVARLSVPPREDGYRIRVIGPGHGELVMDGVHLHTGLVSITVEAAGAVRGQVHPIGAVAAYSPDASVRARFAAWVDEAEALTEMMPALVFNRIGGGSSHRAPIGEDGRFSIVSMRPGKYLVLFSVGDVGIELQEFEVECGVISKLAIDVEKLRPCELTVEWSIDGEALAWTEVAFEGKGDESSLRGIKMRGVSDAQGLCRWVLPRGTYLPHCLGKTGEAVALKPGVTFLRIKF